ncbi:MAG: AtzG-like protein [Pseudomonadota bacterium]
MDEEKIAAYVGGTAAVLGLPLAPERAARVVAHLQRTAAMAALLDAAPLAPHDELAEIYSPAAFPPTDDEGQQL